MPEPQYTQYRPSYLAVSITVTATAQLLTTIIETQLGLVPGSLAKDWREVQIQVDPETSSSATVRLGLKGNLGTTVNGVVQKGTSLVGQSDTFRGVYNNVDLSMMAAQTTTSTAVLNLQMFAF